MGVATRGLGGGFWVWGGEVKAGIGEDTFTP